MSPLARICEIQFIASVSRSTVRSTNTEPAVKRRQFIRTAAGSTATLLAACKSTSNNPGVAVVTQGQTTVADTAATLPADTVAPTTTDSAANNAEATVWRLSTRNQRAPCAACKAHAAHRLFVSDASADAGRAHAGCACEVRAQRTTVGQMQVWFGEGAQAFDDRWTT